MKNDKHANPLPYIASKCQIALIESKFVLRCKDARLQVNKYTASFIMFMPYKFMISLLSSQSLKCIRQCRSVCQNISSERDGSSKCVLSVCSSYRQLK